MGVYGTKMDDDPETVAEKFAKLTLVIKLEGICGSQERQAAFDSRG